LTCRQSLELKAATHQCDVGRQETSQRDWGDLGRVAHGGLFESSSAPRSGTHGCNGTKRQTAEPFTDEQHHVILCAKHGQSNCLQERNHLHEGEEDAARKPDGADLQRPAILSASSSQRHGGVHYGMTEVDRAVAYEDKRA
jgi:hypothetical protein